MTPESYGGCTLRNLQERTKTAQQRFTDRTAGDENVRVSATIT